MKFKNQMFKDLSKTIGKYKRRLTVCFKANGEVIEVTDFLFPNQIKRQVPDCHRFMYEWGSGNGVEMSNQFIFSDLNTVIERK